MNTESKMCQNLKVKALHPFMLCFIYLCIFFLNDSLVSFVFPFQVATLAMSGEIADAVTLLSAAFLPKSPYFIKKTEFSQEVVSAILLLLHLIFFKCL